MAKNSTREISEDCNDIPAGWPRPFYREDGNIKYAQWSSGRASSQILHCDRDRTGAAAAHFLCSSCGHQMSKGLIFDREWLVENAEKGAVLKIYDENSRAGATSLRVEKFDEFDTHYGSPICYRCALFAVVQCPYFSEMHRVMGGDIKWLVITSPMQYREFDESNGLEVIDPDSHERIMTSDIRVDVQGRTLHLTDLTAHDFEWKRPEVEERDDFGSVWGKDAVWNPEDKKSLELFFSRVDWKADFTKA